MEKKMKLPDLDSIVSGFNSKSDQQSDINDFEDKMIEDSIKMSAIVEAQCEDLWNSFMRALKEEHSKQSSGDGKMYKIDSDIIETITQCELNAPTTTVINSMLRVFIISNISRMASMRKVRPLSLFDKLNPK